MELVIIIVLVGALGAAIYVIFTLQGRVKALIAEKTEAATKLEMLRERASEQKAELEELQSGFRAEFRNLANDIFDEKSKQFRQSNKESMESLLTPFKLNISDFRERVEKIYAAENIERGALKGEIKNLMELNRLITDQTTNLTNALKGESKVQGDWGEMILETILESSNLIKGVHYTTQQTIKDEESGANIRPDVILTLPEGKQIVIDSKVSLTAFVEYTSAEEPAKRDAALKAHLISVRRHIEELGRKSYQATLNSPDFVIMFVANEPAFLAAMHADSSLWSEAYNKKVIISSPTNLFALLKIVDDMWRRDNQSKNAIAIATEGANLYDKFVGFVQTLEELGKSIEASSQRYDKAMGQLSTGKGSLVTRTEKLRELGVKATKTLSLPNQDED